MAAAAQGRVEEGENGGVDLAAAEGRQLASGKSKSELERQAEELEHGRTQRFKEHFERIAIWTLYIVSIGMGVATAIWFLHIIAPAEPTKLRWLAPSQVQALQNGITGVILIGVLADHFKKRLG